MQDIPICGVTFEDCCTMCIGNKMFIKEFNRLNNLHLGESRSPLNKAIDEVCGYDPDEMAMPVFIEFVMKYVWLPYVHKMMNEGVN